MGAIHVGQKQCTQIINALSLSRQDFTIYQQHSVTASAQRCRPARARVPSFTRSLTRRVDIVRGFFPTIVLGNISMMFLSFGISDGSNITYGADYLSMAM